MKAKSFSWHRSEERVPAPCGYGWDHRGLSIELIKILAPELCDVVLVSLRQPKALVSMKRFRFVHLHIMHEKFLKENPVIFTHIYRNALEM